MFIGHFAAALAGKRADTHVSLGTLFLSVQFLDLLWPVFLLLGWEHVRIDPGNKHVPLEFTDYPYTHSLLAALVWSLLFGLVYWARYRRRGAAVLVGAGVLSHWLLDLIVHRPDLPLAPGVATPRLGLGLWNWPIATLALEVPLYLIGAALYLRATRARDAVGRWGLWSLLLLLLVIHVGNLFGPPPPSAQAVAVVSLAVWLFVPWAYWVDRHREPRLGAPGSIPPANTG
jgi:hypothetical protein